MALQMWQEATKGAPESIRALINQLNAARPIADARWNVNTAADSYAVLEQTGTAYNTLMQAMAGAVLPLEADSAGDPAFQKYWGLVHQLWMHLRAFYQGKNVLSCDAGYAQSIQDLLAEITAEGALAARTLGFTGSAAGGVTEEFSEAPVVEEPKAKPKKKK